MRRAFLVLLAWLTLQSPVQGDLIVTSYACSLEDVIHCAVERDTCISFPRMWRRGYDAQYVCSCWAQSFMCYKDCNNNFPANFEKACLEVCPSSVCKPQIS
jgi:hypothetical protein